MKKLLFGTLLFLFPILGCEKENKPDWRIKTSFIFLDDVQDPIPRFYRVSERCLLLSTNYNYPPDSWQPHVNDSLYKILIDKGNLTIKSLPTISVSVRDISFVDENIGYLLTYDHKLYSTKDGGMSWDLKKEYLYFFEIHFTSSDNGIAVNNRKILTTLDGGVTWNEINNKFYVDLTDLVCFYHIPDKPNICFISNARKLYYSIDGGFNWNLHSIHNLDIQGISFINENEGYIQNSWFSSFQVANSIYKIDRIGGIYSLAYDGNMTYGKHGPIDFIQAKDPSNIYFIEGTLFKTTDNFKTIRKMTFEGVHSAISDLYLSTEYGILIDMNYVLYFCNN